MQGHFAQVWKDAPLSSSKKLERLRTTLKFAVCRKCSKENAAEGLGSAIIKTDTHHALYAPSRINRSVLNSPSTFQKTDSIIPIPFRCLAPEVTQGSYQASVIRRGNRPLIHKDNATVPPLFFSPTLQQWRNRPPIVGDQRQSPLGSLWQTC